MKKAGILLSVFISLYVVGLTQAEQKEIGVTIDATYVSKYIWHGFNFYGHDNAAFQPSIDFDLWGTGFGVTVWHSRAFRSGLSDLEEFDYIVYYGDSAFEETSYAMDYVVSWLYYDFYDTRTRDSDLQELMTQFSWPDLLPCKIVPSYIVGKLWQSRSGSAALKNVGGWIHVLGLGYDWTIPGVLPETSNQVVSLMADLTYNDGYGAAGVDHDWSHATLGASTSLGIANNLTFTPGMYYQISLDDSVNDEDEVWTSLSLTCNF